jgi:hypothetical protein
MKGGSLRLEDNRIKQTKNELQNLIALTQSLVIKDSEEAEKHETVQSSKNGYKLITAMDKTDVPADYGIDTKGKTSEQVNELMIEKRQNFIDNYEELNQYYIDLNKEHGISYYNARKSEDYYILDYDGFELGEYKTSIFIQEYYSALNYFMSAVYTKAFEDYNLYRNFVRLLIVFLAIQNYLNKSVDNIGNIDLFDEYSIRNMFISYGLDYFANLPIKYQRRLLKNINQFIKYKGTNRIIVDIVNLFDFDNIEVFKYFLSKGYEEDEMERIDFSKPKLSFYKVPYEMNDPMKNLESIEELNYDSFIADDPYWQANKEDILDQDFNMVNTKYITINSTMNLLKESISSSYFFNTLRKLKTNDTDNLLKFFNSGISQNEISLYDAIISLHILVSKKLGYKDNIVTSLDGLQKVFSYNFDYSQEDLNYKIKGKEYTLTDKDLEKITQVFQNSSLETLEFYDIDDETEDVNKNRLLDYIFNLGEEARVQLEREIERTDDYYLYKKFKKLWKLKYVNDYHNEFFADKDYTTYSEYILDQDSDLHNFITYDENGQELTEEQKDTINEKILTLSSDIDNYIDSEDFNYFLKQSLLASDQIKQYMYQIINVFKSYTIDLKEITINMTFNNKMFNTLRAFDETIERNFIQYTDYKQLDEKLDFHNEILGGVDRVVEFEDSNSVYSYYEFNKLMNLLTKIYYYMSDEFKDSIDTPEDFYEQLNSLFDNDNIDKLVDRIDTTSLNSYDDLIKRLSGLIYLFYFQDIKTDDALTLKENLTTMDNSDIMGSGIKNVSDSFTITILSE